MPENIQMICLVRLIVAAVCGLHRCGAADTHERRRFAYT